MIVLITLRDLIIELKTLSAFLLLLLARLAFYRTFYAGTERIIDMIVDSHFFISSVVGLDERKVWNNVEAFVCLNESVDNSDFLWLMLDSFLLENCKNEA